MNITVCQRAMTHRFTIQLYDGPLLHIAILINVPKNLLHDFSLCRSGRPSKNVERYVKPLVDLLVKLVVFVTDLARGKSLLLSFCFRGCAILVRAADINDVNFALAQVSTINVRTENCSDNIAKMGIIVDIRKGTCDENIARRRERKRGIVDAHDGL